MHFSDQAALVNRTTLIDARRRKDDQRGTGDGAQLPSVLRAGRPYACEWLISQRKRYSEMLDAHAGVRRTINSTVHYVRFETIQAQLQCNNSGPDAAAAARLEAFASAILNGAGHAHSGVLRGQQLQREIAERGQYFAGNRWCHFGESGDVPFFTRMIIGPRKYQSACDQPARKGVLCNSVLFSGLSELRLAKRILWLRERSSWLESQRHQF